MASWYFSKPSKAWVTTLLNFPAAKISWTACQSSGSDDNEPLNVSCRRTTSSVQSSASLLPDSPSRITVPPGATSDTASFTASGVPAASSTSDGGASASAAWRSEGDSRTFQASSAPSASACFNLVGCAPTKHTRGTLSRTRSTCSSNKPTAPSPTTTTQGWMPFFGSGFLLRLARRTALQAVAKGSASTASSHGVPGGSTCSCQAGKRITVWKAPSRPKKPVSFR
mmetsp:Transcript_44122/g.95891  ORF Transcript_44122/g.95891 Transcript_44122/m.95891 type:complete len:226 (-) Transcript_44122:428-1105(-)